MTNIVLIRHGQSLGNVIDEEIRVGNFKHCTPELLANGDPLWQLSPLGITQSRIAGAFLRQQFPRGFEKIFCSPYRRAEETLQHLGMGNGTSDSSLQEQDWGVFLGKDIVHHIEEHKQFDLRYPFDVQLRPPGGETVAEVYNRVAGFWQRERPRSEGASILVVTHWVPMFLTRLIFNGIPLDDFYPSYHTNRTILNCQIDMYTDLDPLRQHPEKDLSWTRSICLDPHNPTDYPWQKI